MTKQELIKAVEISVRLYGREATLKALNQLYRDGRITREQALDVLDALHVEKF